MFDGQKFTHAGHNFRVSIATDCDTGAPWKEHDGHGIVSDWTSRDKRPGELELASDGRGRARNGVRRFYDFAETVKIARRDGWNAAPYEIEGETPRQRAARATMADFERLRAWCADEWYWVGVTVELLDDFGDSMGETESLWGIESDADEHIGDVARELAEEIIARMAQSLAA